MMYITAKIAAVNCDLLRKKRTARKQNPLPTVYTAGRIVAHVYAQ